MIFNDKHNSPVEIATKAASIIAFFMDSTPSLRKWPVIQDLINQEIP